MLVLGTVDGGLQDGYSVDSRDRCIRQAGFHGILADDSYFLRVGGQGEDVFSFLSRTIDFRRLESHYAMLRMTVQSFRFCRID